MLRQPPGRQSSRNPGQPASEGAVQQRAPWYLVSAQYLLNRSALAPDPADADIDDLRTLVEDQATAGRPQFARAAPGPGSAAGEEVEVGLGQGGRVLQRDVVTGLGDDGAADVSSYLRELPGYLIAEVGLRADG